MSILSALFFKKGVKPGGSDNELALVSKQQKRFVDLNVGDLLSELLGIYSRDLKKSFKYHRPLKQTHVLRENPLNFFSGVMNLSNGKILRTKKTVNFKYRAFSPFRPRSQKFFRFFEIICLKTFLKSNKFGWGTFKLRV